MASSSWVLGETRIDERTGLGLVRGIPATHGDGYPLNTTTLIRHGARTHGDQQIVYRTPEGSWERYSYADAHRRIQQGAHVLTGLGVRPGSTVGVLDWNTRRHFELYYAIPGLAAVLLQMNLRLGEEDLAYVVNHSAAELIAVDESLLPVAEAIAPKLTSVRGWIILSDRPLAEIETCLENVHHYEDLLAAADGTYDWPFVDEASAYSACYTTGTTGRPKGIYYSHRGIYLHSMALAANLGMTLDDTTMLITPMFHGQAWGLPQAATLMANKIVLPGRYQASDTKLLVDAMIAEGVTVTNGAPAIFAPMLQYIETLEEKPDLSRARMLSGATEPPLSLMRGFYDQTGAEIVHVYGATETTPLVTLNRFKPSVRARLGEDELWDLKRRQGLPVTGVDIKIIDEHGNEAAHDGFSIGEVAMRGPWITTRYHEMEDSGERFVDGYWRSGDAGTIDKDGYLKLTDRLKDIIKSGGEWISSIDMENALCAHPKISEAAVIGVYHPKWQERPVALVVPRGGQTVTGDEVREALSRSFASWQLPEAVVMVSEIARTSVGKVNKKLLREQYADTYSPEPAEMLSSLSLNTTGAEGS